MFLGSFRPRDLIDRRSKKKEAARSDTDVHSTRSHTPSRRSSQRTGSPSTFKSPTNAFTGPTSAGPIDPWNHDPKMIPISANQENQRPLGRPKTKAFSAKPCVFCEEPLTHTLAGERVLHFTCSHVAHEECFYETLREAEMAVCPICDTTLALDVTRGGSRLDIDKLVSAVRTTPNKADVDPKDEYRVDQRFGAAQTSPVPPPQGGMYYSMQSHGSQMSRTGSTDTDNRSKFTHGNHPNRNNSFRSETIPGNADPTSTARNSHVANLQQNMRGTDSNSVASAAPASLMKLSVRNPVPSPTVTIKSEFPTVTRSSVPQSITCLVSISVSGDWKIAVEDLATIGVGSNTPAPQHASSAPTPTIPENRNSFSKSHKSMQLDTPSPEELEKASKNLLDRVEQWHNLDFNRFGDLLLFGQVRVGKDNVTWQDLDCYLFTEMLICIKDKKLTPAGPDNNWEPEKRVRANLKGSILIQKHLQSAEITQNGPEPVLTLSLSVPALPAFHLKFMSMAQLLQWQRLLNRVCNLETPLNVDYNIDNSGTDEDESCRSFNNRRISSTSSSTYAKTYNTAATNVTNPLGNGIANMGSVLVPSLHVPVDLVVVVPVYSSMQGLKISILRDTLRFLVASLGDRDRMGLVTFGTSNGPECFVGLSSKSWNGWKRILDGLRPVGQKNPRADVVEGTNLAMNLLMQRQASNPLGAIFLISDSSSAENGSIDFVVSRAEAAKVNVYSFGLGLSHKPDTMIELSARTKAPYIYVKDWMMLRESVAGCLGALQSTSHQNAKLRLRLPEGSPVQFAKITGALNVTKRVSGRDAEACLGDLVLGCRRDILVQLSILPDSTTETSVTPNDHWETLVSGLEALGRPSSSEEGEDLNRRHSIEEVPLLQADLVFGDVLQSGVVSKLPRPVLLTVPFFPAGDASSANIPPAVAIVQRRMELLTSDMLSRALGLVSRGQHDRAHHLLTQTRSIIANIANQRVGGQPGGVARPQNGGSMGLGIGFNGPPVMGGGHSMMSNSPFLQPSQPSNYQLNEQMEHNTMISEMNGNGLHSTQLASANGSSPNPSSPAMIPLGLNGSTPTVGYRPYQMGGQLSGVEVDPVVMKSLDDELASALEWILHPAVFGRDARKSVLQSIGVISCQRAYSFYTGIEQIHAGRVASIRNCVEASRSWREEDEGIREEM